MRLFITLFYSLLLFCILFSCRDESSSIGAKWVDSSFMNAVTDTCTVTLSTLLSDSLATSGDTVCQIGRYKDNLYGEIKTSFYAEDIGEKTNGKKTVGNTILIMTGGHNAKICPTMQQPGMALPDSQ